MDFWNRLRNELDYKGITHKELADKLGIIKGSLESKFARENTPDAEFVYQCSRVLDLPMDYLYTGQSQEVISDDEAYLIVKYRYLSPDNKKLVKGVVAALAEK